MLLWKIRTEYLAEALVSNRHVKGNPGYLYLDRAHGCWNFWDYTMRPKPWKVGAASGEFRHETSVFNTSVDPLFRRDLPDD